LLVSRHQRTGERALRRLPDLGLLSDRLQGILLGVGLWSLQEGLLHQVHVQL